MVLEGIMFGLGHALNHIVIRPLRHVMFGQGPPHVAILLQGFSHPDTESRPSVWDMFTSIDEGKGAILGTLSYFHNARMVPENECTGLDLLAGTQKNVSQHYLRLLPHVMRDLRKHGIEGFDEDINSKVYMVILPYEVFCTLRGEIPSPSTNVNRAPAPLSEILERPRQLGLAVFDIVISTAKTDWRDRSKALPVLNGVSDLARALRKLGFEIATTASTSSMTTSTSTFEKTNSDTLQYDFQFDLYPYMDASPMASKDRSNLTDEVSSLNESKIDPDTTSTASQPPPPPYSATRPATLPAAPPPHPPQLPRRTLVITNNFNTDLVKSPFFAAQTSLLPSSNSSITSISKHAPLLISLNTPSPRDRPFIRRHFPHSAALDTDNAVDALYILGFHETEIRELTAAP